MRFKVGSRVVFDNCIYRVIGTRVAEIGGIKSRMLHLASPAHSGEVFDDLVSHYPERRNKRKTTKPQRSRRWIK